MELKDLEKWVNEYELIFKMTMSSHSGCVVRVYKKGYDMPMYQISGTSCIETLSMMHHLLQSKVKEGALECVNY